MVQALWLKCMLGPLNFSLAFACTVQVKLYQHSKLQIEHSLVKVQALPHQLWLPNGHPWIAVSPLNNVQHIIVIPPTFIRKVLE